MNDGRKPLTETIQLYSLTELAETLQMSAATLRRHIKAGKLQATLIGGKYLVTVADAIAYIQPRSSRKPNAAILPPTGPNAITLPPTETNAALLELLSLLPVEWVERAGSLWATELNEEAARILAAILLLGNDREQVLEALCRFCSTPAILREKLEQYLGKKARDDGAGT